MATPNKLVFSTAGSAAGAGSADAKTVTEFKINEESKKQFEALIKEIESGKNFKGEYAKLSEEEFGKAAAAINNTLVEAGRGSAVMMRRAVSTEVAGQAWYEYRLYTKIYPEGSDYGFPGIEKYIIKLSCLEAEKGKMIEIFEENFDTGAIEASHRELCMSDGDVRLAYPDSSAGKNPQYRKLGQ